MKKRLLALLLTLAMLLSMTAGAFAEDVQLTELVNAVEAVAVQEEPVQEQPVQEEPVQEEPAQEQPVQEEPAQEEPAQEEPAQEEPAQEQPAHGDEADAQKAQAVIDMISTIGEVTPESAAAIESAAQAYDALTPAQKQLVSNYDVLVSALAKLLERNASSEAESVYPITGECGDLAWSLGENGEITISGKGEMANYAAENSQPWASYAQEIRSVVVEEDVTAVGSAAFYGDYVNLKYVSLPDTLTRIGDQAFRGCKALEKLVLPEALTEIGANAFLDCEGLKKASFAGSAQAFAELVIGDGNEALTDVLEAPAAQVPTGKADTVEAVETLIDAIGEVTLESEDAIAAALEAYEALSDEEKALVSNYDVLEAAIAAFTSLNGIALLADESAKPVLHVMINSTTSATGGNPAKAVLGEDGILRIENRGTTTYNRLWLGTEDDATVTSLEVFQGLPTKNSVPSQSKRTSYNVYDGTTFQVYYNSGYFKLPLVARATVTAADGETSASYYIIASAGAAGSYVVSASGFTADSETLYSAENGIAFTEADSTVTLTPVTASIGSGTAQDVAWNWATSDPTVALVDANGTVTSIGGGTAEITASYDKVSVSCKVVSTAAAHDIHSYEDGACTVCGTKEPSAVKAYFTLADQNGSYALAKDGSTRLSKVEMSVTDADMDGTVTINDAFLCAHAQFCEDGAAGYATQSGSYGAYITKLWGVETSSVGYYVNNKTADGLNVALKAKDSISAFYYRDGESYSDLYTYFESDSAKAVENKAAAFTVKGDNGAIPSGATVTVYDGEGKAVDGMNTTVGADGSFTLTFAAAGSYTVEVSGKANYTGSVWDAEAGDYVSKDFTDAPITPALLNVTVYPYAKATVYMTLSDKSGSFAVGKSGAEIYRLPLTVEDDPADPDGAVTLLEVAAALHAQQYSGGLDGFSASTSWVSKFWGDTSGSFGYFLNDVYMSGSGTKTGTNGREFQDKLMATVVADGDCFNFFLYQTNYWSDQYTYFNPVNETALVGTPKTITAYANSWGRASAPEGATITVSKDGKAIAELATTVGSDGSFTIDFPQSGVYTVDLSNGESKYFVPSRCKVTVRDVVTGITLDKTELTLGEDESATLTATLQPEGAAGTEITWSTSDDKVATVKDGVVTASYMAGTATITAKSGEYEATCEVTVTTTAVDSGKYGNVIWRLRENGTLEFSAVPGSDGKMGGSISKWSQPTYIKKYNAQITSIVVKEGVTSISNYAFYTMSAVTSVSLPSTLASIGDDAFEGVKTITSFSCAEGCMLTVNGKFVLKNKGTEIYTYLGAMEGVITIPDGVTKVGALFSGSDISGIIFPDSVKEISGTNYTTWNGPFVNCKKLESVTIPCDITQTGVFKGCTALKEVTFKEGVTAIADYTFNNCTSLTTINLPKSLVSFNGGAFSGCPAISTINCAEGSIFSMKGNLLMKNDTEIVFALPGVEITGELVIPEGITTIAAYAYQNKTGITSVKFPSTLTSIGSFAFSGCTGITGELVIPEGVTTVGREAFRNCTGITSVKLPSTLTTIGQQAFDSTSITALDLPKSVTKIDYGAFQNTKIKTLYLPDGLNLTASSVFGKCTELTEVSAGGDVTGNGVFGDCTALTTVTVREGAAKIGSRAFQGCTALTTVNLPKSLTSLDAQAFYGCTALKTINFAEGSIYRFQDGIIYEGNKILFVLTLDQEELTIADGITEIGNSAFQKQTILKKVTLPDSIVKIGDQAFNGCTNLASINLPKNLEELGYSAFNGCTSLPMVTIPASLKKIGNQAFRGCTGMKGRLLLPATVTYFGQFAFGDCTGITSVYFEDAADPANTTYSERIFDSCTNLTDLRLPENLTKLNNMIYHCYGLRKLVLPESIKEFARDDYLPDGFVYMDLKGIEKFSTYTMSNMMNLKELYLSANLTDYPDTGRNCHPEIIYFRGTEEQWNAVNFASTTLENFKKYGTVIVFNYGSETGEAPKITLQPVGATYEQGLRPTPLTIEAEELEGAQYVYQWYRNGEYVASGKECPVSTTEAGEHEYYCMVRCSVNGKYSETKSDVAIITVIALEQAFEGEGTSENPYKLSKWQDLERLSVLVEGGESFEGKVFEMTENITLPSGWIPIGCTKDGSNGISKGANLNAFSGVFDGGNKLLTVPAGGRPLFAYVNGATIRNLNIYGSQIDGYGLVDCFTGVGMSGIAMTIDHVTLKSGTKVRDSGLIGARKFENPYAGCSAGYNAIIRNCTIESGVVIGYNGDSSEIGGFAGRMQGTIENCVNHGTVKGKDYVGGIIGTIDNAMGACDVLSCTFDGKVIASGSNAGGIVGGGYTDSSAPNGKKVTVKSCNASGSVSGDSNVGGILGGDVYVAQSWDNVKYSFKNNTFTGKVSGNSNVGAIIGFYDSLNRIDDISGNQYSRSCGADKPVGKVYVVDTNYENPTAYGDTLYCNTEDNVSGCPSVAGCSWKTGYNRTDDPLGADADKLWRAEGTAFIEVTEVTLDKTELNLKIDATETLTATVLPEDATDNSVTWTSSNEDVATVEDGVVTAKAFGKAVITATAGSVTAECSVNVTAEPAENITVYMTVSDRGVLAAASDGAAMFNRSVNVTDLNSDGVLTYDEALQAAHTAYCPGGYENAETEWGVSVSKLWNVSTMNCLFFLNDSALANHVGDTETSALHAGDYLVASVNKDNTYYADHYVSFAKRSATATVGKEFALNLSGSKGSDKIVIGTWNTGKFTAIDGAKIDADGSVTLTFAEAGIYLLTAEGTISDSVQDWSAGGAYVTADCPIIAPGCWVKVETASVDPDAKAEKLEISGDYKKSYAVGDKLDLTGMVLTVYYSDGTTREIAAGDVTVTGFDTETRGEKTVTLSYEGVSASFTITVTKAAGTIDVTISVLGDSKHGGSSGKVHTLKTGGLSTWIKATTYNVADGSTVWQVLKQCLDEHNMSYTNPTGNYVSSVNGLAEFDNGKNSGWMYTLNGKYPLLGVSQQKLKDGDRIIFHYTDDYTLENTGFSPDPDDPDTVMVDAVEKLIDGIGEVTFDDACKAKIDAARKAYDKLTFAEKKQVDNYQKLQDAEAKYNELKKADDQAKADEVIKLIEEMGSDKDKIKAARDAYNKLTEAQKKLVSNYNKLTSAEYTQASSIATGSDRQSAQDVIDQIDAIGDKVDDAAAAKIDAARKAYDKLSDTQKALVTNYDKLEAAEAALARLTKLAGFENLYRETGEALEALGTPDVGSIGGEWMVIGLARSGREVDVDGYYAKVLEYVEQNIDENGRLDPNKCTDNARIILALTALGKDVTDVGGHDLLSGLNEMAYITKQGINGPIWALIALDSNNYDLPEGDVTRDALIACILDAQLEDGGWAFSGEDADSDMTAMALTALAPYYVPDAEEKTELDLAVEKGIECLAMLQFADGSFGTYGMDGEMVSTCESTAQAVVALTALNIDPDTDERFIKNGSSALDALAAYGLPGGGFKHLKDGDRDAMATEQGYYALTAFARYLMELNRLYDMSDVFDENAETIEPLELYIRIAAAA